jgi:hypothetical protein
MNLLVESESQIVCIALAYRNPIGLVPFPKFAKVKVNGGF